ncbi:MAG: hypothetical protein B6D41_03070 [Chloroflexi bacterium UTCFX4]|nr:MAG: hypothetical protein B6D41_03070 [Chloroflexi bacterium UTCFX4]
MTADLRAAMLFMSRRRALEKRVFCVTCDDRMIRHADCCERITSEHGFRVKLVRPEEFVAQAKNQEQN